MTDINKIIKDARNVLVGKVPDPQSQIDQITLALIYKFMDAKDAEAIALGIEPQFFVGECADYSFSKIMQATSNPKQYQMYTQGIDLLQKRSDLPETFTNVFKDAFIPYRDASTLHLFLEEINKIPTENTEILGTAFEDLLSIMGSQGDAGQFRTPRHIIDMIVDIVEPKKGETILDPACGTAGFLISAYNKISKQDLTIEEREKLINEGLVGYDINPNMVKLSHVNLFLHGCKKPNIHLYDTLSDKDFWKDNYDVILANPPFMTPRGGIRPHELFSAINANRSEVLFTYYIAKHLKSNGRAGIIVPEGVVFQSANAYKNLRAMLVEENYLYAVISLPAGVFNPYSGVKTSVLLFDKALARRTDKILFVKMNNDGFDLGAQRRPIEKNDIPEIVKIVKKFAFCVSTESEKDFIDDSGLSIVATKDEIAKNDYVLVGNRYALNEFKSEKYVTVYLGNKELFQVESGGTPSSTVADYWKGEINWVTLEDLPPKNYITEIKSTKRTISDKGLKNSNAKILPVNTILVSTRATIGRVGIAKCNLATNQGFKNIIVMNKGRVFYKYVAYMMTSLKDKMTSLSSGGTFREISKSNFLTLGFPLPPIEMQEQIVDELESYQKIIHGARQIVENYSANINIKNNWTEHLLGDICEIYNGSTPSKSISEYWAKDDIPWFTINDIRNQGRIIRTTEKYISNEALEKTSIKLLPSNSVLLCCTASVGEYAYTEIPLTTNQQFNGLVIKAEYKDKIIPKFLFYYATNFKQYLEKLGGQTAFKFVSVKDVKTIPVLIPSFAEQSEIIQSLEAEQSVIDSCQKLIEVYRQKIKDKINEAWGSETK